jgi:hypothetical protein
MTTTKYLDSIECSDQPLDISFHPKRENLVAAALVDGTVEGMSSFIQSEKTNN